MRRILLSGGEVVSSKGVERKDVLIEEGKIGRLGLDFADNGLSKSDASKLNPKGVEVIDCSGKLIFPGLIDVHVHFREPGGEYKEDFESGSRAAVAGGITTVCDMPNNQPAILMREDLEAKRALVGGRSFANYGLYIGYNGENIDEINACENVAGVKVYVANSTGNMGVNNDSIEKLFRETDKRIVLHCEDEGCIEERMRGVMAEYEGRLGEIPPEVHSEIRSEECASKAVEFVCELASRVGRPVHIAHVSTAAEIEVINKFRAYGVTCEVAPHHLMLSIDDYVKWRNFIKVNPPVRSSENLFALWKALKFGEIDIIATDHAPHSREEKAGGYLDVPSGMPECDTLGPWLFNCINDEGLSAEEVVRLCCERPAELFGMEGKGRIEEGFDADIVVVDMDKEQKVESDMLFTKCGWSPYEGMTFKGWPEMTFVNGELAYKDGGFVGKACGKEIVFNN